jgi:hypothetical protein
MISSTRNTLEICLIVMSPMLYHIRSTSYSIVANETRRTGVVRHVIFDVIFMPIKHG